MSEFDVIDVEAVEIDDNENHEDENTSSSELQSEMEEQRARAVSEIVEEEKRENVHVERYSSSSRNKTYSSVKRDTDVMFDEKVNHDNSSKGNTNYYDSQKTTYVSNRATRNTLMIIMLIVTAPVWIPVICSIFGVLIGLVCAAFGIVFGLGCAGLGIIVGGVTLFIVGVCKLLITPLVAMAMTGLGLLLTGFGLLFATIMFAIGCKVLPVIIGVIGKFVAWVFRGIGGRKHE